MQIPLLMLLLAIPFFIYVVKNDKRGNDYKFIAKKIFSHNLSYNYNKLDNGQYSITYVNRVLLKPELFYLDIYLHKNGVQIGVINYVLNSYNLREKCEYNEIPLDDLKEFVKLIKEKENDPEWI